MGLLPTVNKDGGFNTQNPNQNGVLTPVVYHGGQTMTDGVSGVTVHAIFWTPNGTSFPLGPNAKTNKQMVEQYYTDVAAASTGTSGSTCTGSACNVFTVEPQYAFGTIPGSITPGQNTINFNSAKATTYPSGFTAGQDNVITDTDPIPTGISCTSPNATKYCITDQQLQTEIANIIAADGGNSVAGLQNLWFVFLPPDVDECIAAPACGTTAFGGYHSSFNNDPGATNTQAIYAVAIDPVIEVGSISQGADPQGNPDGEVVINIAAHETNEAMSDPLGTGWMNPNGWEIGDMCEFGPQNGTPLGTASDATLTANFDNGAPYNQVINGHDYLIQEMWSNDGDAANPGVPNCVQGTNQTGNPLPLPQVNLTQFSNQITGNIGSNNGGVGVTVSLVRADPTSFSGVTTVDTSNTGVTNGTGDWNVTLPAHAVGDDRDEIDIEYSGTIPAHLSSILPPCPNTPSDVCQVILTGNGGNPFIAAGWMGWSDLDNGEFVTNAQPFPFLPNAGNPALLMGPCTQTGVLGFAVNGTPGPSPTDFCGIPFSIADVPISPVSNSDVVTASSNDNRGFAPADTQTPSLSGGLVNLTVPLGEPDSVSSFAGANFPSTGFPTCTADLGMQTVTCTGLIPGNQYTITDATESGESAAPFADFTGTASAEMLIKRSDTISLSNGSRTLTTLNVANLQVGINDADPSVVASGSCSGGDYWGGPLNTEPTNGSAGEPSSGFNGGVADTGMICPTGGDASGMPTPASQTDELSGGTTQVNLPDVADTSPMEGETVYGAFTALAEATAETPTIALSIAHASGGAPVFSSANVDTANGSPVPALAPGTYKATWTVSDPNGDTRTMTTRFIEQASPQGPQGQQGPPGPQGPQGPKGPKPKVTCKLTGKHHNKIKCKVTFPHHAGDVSGRLQMRISRGARIAALGRGQVRHGAATLTMRERRGLSHGVWRITLVLSGKGQRAQTMVLSLRIR